MSERTAVAIDLGGTNSRAARVRADGEIVERVSHPTPSSDGPGAILDRLVELVRACRGDASDAELAGVGIGFPGFLYLPEGKVYHAPNLPGWEDVELRKRLEERLGVTVACENDANAAALGERAFGAARDATDFVQITLGTGLGSGFVLGGAIYHGARGMAGELGHIPVDLSDDAFTCGCGRRGCLETLVSKRGFWNLASAAWSRGEGTDGPLHEAAGGDPAQIDLEEAATLARGGDAFTRDLYAQMGRWLGVGLAVVANALNLEMAVVGGGVASAWDLFIEAATDELKARALPAVAESMQVAQSTLGDDAGMLGAASLVL